MVSLPSQHTHGLPPLCVGVDEVDGGKSESREGSPQHRISKHDISNPTRTTGPLFKTGTTFDSDEEDNLQLNMTDRRAKVRGQRSLGDAFN